jgi:hypothetical protein
MKRGRSLNRRQQIDARLHHILSLSSRDAGQLHLRAALTRAHEPNLLFPTIVPRARSIAALDGLIMNNTDFDFSYHLFRLLLNILRLYELTKPYHSLAIHTILYTLNLYEDTSIVTQYHERSARTSRRHVNTYGRHLRHGRDADVAFISPERPITHVSTDASTRPTADQFHHTIFCTNEQDMRDDHWPEASRGSRLD